MSVAGFGVDDLDGFAASLIPSRQLPYKNNWQNAITIEMSSDRRYYFRKVYSILDLFSDVGGLYGAISPISIIILALVNFWSSYQFLMADLFTESQGLDRNDVQWRCCKSLYISMLTISGGSDKNCCLSPSRKQRLRSKSLRYLLDEISITHIIRQLRVLNAAAKQRYTSNEWQELKKSHEYRLYSDAEKEVSEVEAL